MDLKPIFEEEGMPRPCPNCHGTGIVPSFGRFYNRYIPMCGGYRCVEDCIVCKGTGTIPIPASEERRMIMNIGIEDAIGTFWG